MRRRRAAGFLTFRRRLDGADYFASKREKIRGISLEPQIILVSNRLFARFFGLEAFSSVLPAVERALQTWQMTFAWVSDEKIMSENTFKPGAARALFFSTTAFAVSFAVWGLIAALAPRFTEIYKLSATEKSLMIAIPVLLGSIGRLFAGMAADRFGGRKVFTSLLVFSAVPAVAVGFSTSYAQLLIFGLLLGAAGTTFPVGVGFTSKWFSAEKQGTALGIYGMGNVGQSIAVFFAPVLALWFGDWRTVFFVFAAVCLVWGIIFYFFAEDAAAPAKPKTLAENLSVLKRSKIAWILALFYFLTFGGFVALALYLPTFLKEIFNLSATDAGARAAGFVLLATMMRPVGGILADKIGGARVLIYVFAAIGALSLLLSFASIVPFTIGALGCAAALGLGNGAVFKLVPQYFPKETGTVTGLVGAFGGLGGFFPPLELGIVKDMTGRYAVGFVLLAVFAVICLTVNYLTFLRNAEKDVPAMSDVRV
jgi:MFS transporter, NNP family, nitrate/nitrite transporter